MAICPYCKKELRLRLEAQYISQIDRNVFETLEKEVERLPFIAKGIARTSLKHMMNRPMLVYLLVCSECRTVISAKVPTLETNRQRT